MPYDPFPAAVTTAPRPGGVSYLSRTLESLARAGWESPIVCCDHDRTLGPWGNLRRAMRVLLEVRSPSRWIVVFQDDIEVTEGLKRHIYDDCSWQPVHRGIASLYSPAMECDPLFGRGRWNPILRLPGSYGALALVFPRGIAERLLAKTDEAKKTMADFQVAKFCHYQGYNWTAPFPSFVRHIGGVSSLDNPNINIAARQCRLWLPKIGGEPIECVPAESMEAMQ